MGRTEDYYESLLSKLNGYKKSDENHQVSYKLSFMKNDSVFFDFAIAFYCRVAERFSINLKDMRTLAHIFIKLRKN